MNRALINASSGIVQKPLRYVLYVRKSSEDAEAQAKSLPDQIADCKEYANNHGLLLVGEPIQESKSAKKSGNRPLFSQMLKDIEKGKYAAILAWHPDRLSRNSLEAGKIVDMVDNDTIKDLKFPTLEFTNDSSGKLLLNIMFAMSKQYSEHLSESVQRGVDSNFAQGKSSGVPKWGYIRDEATGLYLPDENFPHIRHAWEMIIAGATRSEALAYLRAHNVSRMTKLSRRNKHPRLMVIGDHAMTTIFRDPFYYGVLVQAGHAVDLKQLYPDFKPVVTEEEFNIVQAQTKDRSRREITYFEPLKKERKLFLPFRHLIKCSVCGHLYNTGQKTQKQRKIDDLAEKYAELDKESPKAVKDKLKKDMADLQNDVVNIDERIKQIEAKIKNPEKLRLGLEKFSNSLNTLINRLEKGDLVEKDILVRNMVSNLEIDAQKRVIYRYKSPFNFIFEPEFSTGSPVGDPGGTRTHDTKLKRLVL